MWKLESLRFARYSEPDGIAGQPHGNSDSRGECCCGDRECLGTLLGVVGSGGEFDDEGSVHSLRLCHATCKVVSVSESFMYPEPVVPIAWLLGRWAGVGTGQYPGIEDFRFGQEVVFGCDGRPFLTYHSRAWLLDDDGNQVRPLATESGYWRPQPDNGVEVVLSHPTGYSEVWLGRVTVTEISGPIITGARIEMSTDAVMRTESAKEYSGGQRLYGLVEGDLLWTFDMAAVGEPLTNHLAARLQPVVTDGE